MVVVLCCANEGGDKMSILIKLYNGEIYPADTAVPKTDNYKKAFHTQTERNKPLGYILPTTSDKNNYFIPPVYCAAVFI